MTPPADEEGERAQPNDVKLRISLVDPEVRDGEPIHCDHSFSRVLLEKSESAADTIETAGRIRLEDIVREWEDRRE